MPIFEASHPYFEEALEYQILMVGLASTMPLRTAHQKITELISIINRLNADRNANVRGDFVMPEITSKIRFAQGRNSDVITLYNCDKVFKYISGQAAKPKRVRYSVKKNRLNPNVPEQRRRAAGWPSPGPGQVRDEGADLMSSLVFVPANLIGGAYEKIKSGIVRRHTSNFSNWPVELQFFRHLRNGCFHGNHFDIRKKKVNGVWIDAIDPNAPPKWHLYTMPDDATMNGQQVVGGFFPHNQVLPFLYQIGNIV